MAIALVDCNAFFCSCEIAFRPDLEARPVIVLSNNDGNVVARNRQAKALGIAMAAPFFQLRELITRHQVAYFSSNYALYADMSARVMQTLAPFSPQMEIYSIDEAFLSLKGMEDFNLTALGQSIKQKIWQDVHIPVSVGIAPTKVLAKLANHLAKTSTKAQGVVDLSSKKYHDQALALVPVEEIWGIGRQSAAKLRYLGIRTAKDFRDYPHNGQIQKLLTKVGGQIQQELQGTSCLPLQEFAAKKKQIISSRSFGHPVYLLEELQEAVANFITTAAEKLRAQASECSLLSVYVQTNPFKNTPQYYNLATGPFAAPTADTPHLIKRGWQLLASIFRPGYEYKKAGIWLGEISDVSGRQMDLFGAGDSPLQQQAMATCDRINQRFGPKAIQPAACGARNTQQLWKTLRSHQSPHYTTAWSDILKVNGERPT